MFVMLPYADDNPRKHFPFATILLICINAFVFFQLRLQGNYQDVVEQFGFTPAHFSWLTIVTSMFLHGNFFHLLFNMWFLWIFGDNLEDVLRPPLFIVFYLLAGVFAALMYSFFTSGALAEFPCIGASGAISAVMGAYIVLFYRARIKMLIIFLFWYRFVKINVFVYVGLWFIVQFLFIISQIETGIAYTAHIGGFVFGLIAGHFLNEYFPGCYSALPQKPQPTYKLKL